MAHIGIKEAVQKTDASTCIIAVVECSYCRVRRIAQRSDLLIEVGNRPLAGISDKIGISVKSVYREEDRKLVKLAADLKGTENIIEELGAVDRIFSIHIRIQIDKDPVGIKLTELGAVHQDIRASAGFHVQKELISCVGFLCKNAVRQVLASLIDEHTGLALRTAVVGADKALHIVGSVKARADIDDPSSCVRVFRLFMQAGQIDLRLGLRLQGIRHHVHSIDITVGLDQHVFGPGELDIRVLGVADSLIRSLKDIVALDIVFHSVVLAVRSIKIQGNCRRKLRGIRKSASIRIDLLQEEVFTDRLTEIVYSVCRKIVLAVDLVNTDTDVFKTRRADVITVLI